MERTRGRRLGRWFGLGMALMVAAGAVVALAVGGEERPAEVVGTSSEDRLSSPVAGGADRASATTVAPASNPLPAMGEGAGALASPPNPAPPRATPLALGGPRVVRTAALRVEVGRGSFSPAFDEASRVASSHGGFVVASTTESRDGRPALGSLTLRVPATSFDAARAALARLGRLTEQHVRGEDVGGQLVDVEARLRSLAAQEEALRALMARARTIGETIEVQQQLTHVRQEIEQLSGQKARLDDAVAFATINVELAEAGAAPARPEEPNPLVSGARRAAHGSLAVLGGTLVVAGYAGPLAALALVAWTIWRLATRSRRAVASS